MLSSTPPEPTSKFTPEQLQRLGQVYAMILRWNREEDVLCAPPARQAASTSLASQGNAELAELTHPER